MIFDTLAALADYRNNLKFDCSASILQCEDEITDSPLVANHETLTIGGRRLLNNELKKQGRFAYEMQRKTPRSEIESEVSNLESSSSASLSSSGGQSSSSISYSSTSNSSSSSSSMGPTLMKTWWTTTEPNTEVILPFVSDGTYNCVVDWGDGNVTSGTTWNGTWKNHTYTAPGTYVVSITGKATHWSFNNTGSKDLITYVEDLGNLGWTNLSGAFYGCSNLQNQQADGFWGGDVSKVTNMSSMFRNANIPWMAISTWDTSKVTDMSHMFEQENNPTRTIACDVSLWDTSSVTNMNSIFRNTEGMSPDVTNWNFSNVTDMSFAFYNVWPTFGTSKWNVSKVTDMSFMFYGSTINANDMPDMTSWDVSNVTNMSNMFAVGPVVEAAQTVNWITSKVTDMSFMFSRSFTSEPNVTNWDVSKVTDASYMFDHAVTASPNISLWNTSSLINMAHMFDNAVSATNLDTSNWDTSKVTDMSVAFYNCVSIENSFLASKFWENPSVTDYSDCFTDSMGIANRNVIPIAWGGDLL